MKTRKGRMIESGIIGLAAAGITFGAAGDEVFAQQARRREIAKVQQAEVLQDSLRTGDLDQIKRQYELGYRKWDKDFLRKAAIDVAKQFINLPSMQGKEWLESFRDSYGNLNSETYPTPDCFDLLSSFPISKEILCGKNFRLVILDVTKNFEDDYYQVTIPENNFVGIVIPFGGKEYVWFNWFHVPKKYWKLYPNGNPYALKKKVEGDRAWVP